MMDSNYKQHPQYSSKWIPWYGSTAWGAWCPRFVEVCKLCLGLFAWWWSSVELARCQIKMVRKLGLMGCFGYNLTILCTRKILTSSESFLVSSRNLVEFVLVENIAAFYTFELKVFCHSRDDQQLHQFTYACTRYMYDHYFTQHAYT